MHFFYWFQIVQTALAISRLFSPKQGKEENYHADVWIHNTRTPQIIFGKCVPRKCMLGDWVKVTWTSYLEKKMAELGIKFQGQMLDSVLFSLNHTTFLEHVKAHCLPSCEDGKLDCNDTRWSWVCSSPWKIRPLVIFSDVNWPSDPARGESTHFLTYGLSVFQTLE